jgi:transcriptional antiterminator NusG
MKNLGIAVEETEKPVVVNIDIEVGDSIEVIAGAYEGTVSKVYAINMAKQLVTIEVEMFGRPTSVEIGFTEIKKM